MGTEAGKFSGCKAVSSGLCVEGFTKEYHDVGFNGVGDTDVRVCASVRVCVGCLNIFGE